MFRVVIASVLGASLCAAAAVAGFDEPKPAAQKPDDKPPVKKPDEKPKPPPPAVFTSVAEAGPDYLVQGEYEGTGPDGKKFGAQVVALGDGKFDVYLLTGGLPGAGWDLKGRVKVTAQRFEATTKITGKDLSGEIASGTLTGVQDDKTFTLKRIERSSPTLGAKPPEGAVVLFDGKSLDHWSNGKIVEENLLNCGTNSKTPFGVGKLHIEFRTPFKPKAGGQSRGNSGVYVHGTEIQVLDSFGLTGASNECGALYGKAKPAVNMCLPPLTWQTYDVEVKPGKTPDKLLLTVYHNGVKVHEDFELQGAADKPKSINLQNHGNPVVYRNIWYTK
jgi:hypothetical protein